MSRAQAPELPAYLEWVSPQGMPDRRVAVKRLPDEAPQAVREGIARQRVAAMEGSCPCGGPVYVLDGEGFWCEHEDDCPGLDKNLLAAVVAWGREDRAAVDAWFGSSD